MASNARKRKAQRTARGRFAAVNSAPSSKPAPTAVVIETQEPPVRVQDVELATRPAAPAPHPRAVWPVGTPLPTHYKKTRRQVLPCPACRRVLTNEGGQAVVCVSSGRDVAWFRCKHCGHKHALAVEEV